MNGRFSSHGGGVHHTAYIGGCPESREWHPGDPMHLPDIDKTSRIEAYVTVDAGLWAPTSIGARTWLMKGVHVGHDAVIGEDCELAPHCVVGGHVRIEDKVRVGIGAMFRPFVKVGKGARVGMGAVVVKNVEPYTLVYGNPAREHPWPVDGQPDYGRDPDHFEQRQRGWTREFCRAVSRERKPIPAELPVRVSPVHECPNCGKEGGYTIDGGGCCFIYTTNTR